MDASRESLLERVACGDLAPHDAEVVAAAKDDAEFAAALEELGRTGALLDAVGATDREVIDDSIAATRPEDERLVRESLDAALEQRRAGRGAPRRLWLVAAVALLVAGLGFWASRDSANDGDGGPPQLLSGDVRVESPRGEVARFETFELRYDGLASSKSVTVEFVSVESGDTLFPLTEGLEDGRWTFTDQQRAQLSDAGHVRVRVTVVPRVGDEEEFSAEAWLSR